MHRKRNCGLKLGGCVWTRLCSHWRYQGPHECPCGPRRDTVVAAPGPGSFPPRLVSAPPSRPTLPSTLQRERSRMPVLAALRPSPRNAPSVSVSDLLTAHHGAVPTLGFRPHRCGELWGFLFLAGVLEPICFCASHNSLLLPALPEAWPCLLSALQRAIKTSWGNARKSGHYRKHQSPQ